MFAKVVLSVPGSPPDNTQLLGAGEPFTMRDDPFQDVDDLVLHESGAGIFYWKVNGVPTTLPLDTSIKYSPNYSPLFDGDHAIVRDCSVVDVNVAIGGATAVEGTQGGIRLVFPVTLEHPWLQPISVNYSSSPTGATPATPGTDYTDVSGTLTFIPGEVQKRIVVNVQADAIDEVDETMRVVLSNATGNGLITKASGKGVIVDDDPHPSGLRRLRLGSAVIYPGVLGERTARIPVTITPKPVAATTFTYTTQVVSGGARSRWDFRPTSGTVTMAANQAFAELLVPVMGNDVAEGVMTFRVVATPVTANVAVARSATVTILAAG
jgi:Calx-beta domain